MGTHKVRVRRVYELTEPERAKALAHLRRLAEDRNLTLLTGSKAVEISEATVLAAMPS